MKVSKIRIGILGAAKIAIRSIIPELLNLNEYFELIGVASLSNSNSLEVFDKYKIKRFNSYNDLLDRSIIDAIYIPLPNSLHYEWTKIALERNIHVIVEKSQGCNLAEVKELNELASLNKLSLIENFQFRFHNQLLFIKDQIDKGVIGDLRCMRSSFGFPMFPDKDNIRYKKELGGGALLDAGAYPIKITQIFLGLDLNVLSSSLAFDSQKQIDMWGGAFIKSNNGAEFAEIAFGFDNYYQCNIEFWGSKGRLIANRIFTSPPDYHPEIVIESSLNKDTHVLDPDNHFRNMLLYFYKMIVSGENRETEYIQNINQARLLEQLRLKANEK